MSGYEASPLEKAAPHRKGLGYALGAFLTQCPNNVIVPIMIYVMMSPLTMRMLQNFDLKTLKFEMGHSYEMNVPRDSEEWFTAKRVGETFPAKSGVLMPMLIIATNALPEDAYGVPVQTTLPPPLAPTCVPSTPCNPGDCCALGTTCNGCPNGVQVNMNNVECSGGAKCQLAAPAYQALNTTAPQSFDASGFASSQTTLPPYLATAMTTTTPVATPLTPAPTAPTTAALSQQQPVTQNDTLQAAAAATAPPAPPPGGTGSTLLDMPSPSDQMLAASTAGQSSATNPLSRLRRLTNESAAQVQELNVEGQQFFELNCAMIKNIINMTQSTPHNLSHTQFVSPPFNPMDGTCTDVSLLNLVRTGLSKIMRTDISDSLQELWDQLVSKGRHAMLTFVFPKMDPFCPNAFRLVDDVRAILKGETEKHQISQDPESKIPGLTFMTFSPGSILMDLIEITSIALPKSFLFCVLTCMIIAGVWFGCILIPLKMLFNIMMQITWTYGAALYVYEDGVLAWTGYPGLSPTGDSGLDWTVPVFTLTFILGLAMDYEIFLIERVLEFRHEGFGDRESIQMGLSATATTITCAGLIMVFTFFAQLLGTIPVTNQMGFVLVFAILIDTFIVRTVLVPAVLSLGASWNYFPTRMPPPEFQWLAPGCCGLMQKNHPPPKGRRVLNDYADSEGSEDGSGSEVTDMVSNLP
jgi:hypothetical protein